MFIRCDDQRFHFVLRFDAVLFVQLWLLFDDVLELEESECVVGGRLVNDFDLIEVKLVAGRSHMSKDCRISVTLVTLESFAQYSFGFDDVISSAVDALQFVDD